MNPATNFNHQVLAGEIYGIFRDYLKKQPCKVFIAPFDIRLPKKSIEDKDIYTVLQPDVCVVCE